jgi:uncharacterized membrane protein
MSSVIEPAERAHPSGRRKAVLLLAALVGYQSLVHWTVSESSASALGALLTAAPVVAALIWFLGRSRNGRIGLVALAAAGYVIWRTAEAYPALIYPLPHLAAYGFLLWLFGRTLRAGREALITRLARQVHGCLPEEIARYTRRVTWAWCLFFSGMALASLVLFVAAPLPAWSLFANLLNLPLVVAMYLGEYAWRVWRYPNFSHASIATVYRALSKLDGFAGGR